MSNARPRQTQKSQLCGGLLSHVVLLGHLILQWEAREQEAQQEAQEATHQRRLDVDEAAGDKDGRPVVDDNLYLL